MFTFELICMLLEGYLKLFTLSGFLGVFKIIKIFGFLEHTQPAQANCQGRLSRRRQIVSAGSACVDLFLAQAQHAQANCQPRLSVCVNLFPVFLAHTQPAQAIFQRRLSLRRQFFSAGSACVGNFLAQTQHAQKKQNGEYLPQSSKKKKKLSSPQVTYPYRIYWCKKKWVENLTLGHL